MKEFYVIPNEFFRELKNRLSPQALPLQNIEEALKKLLNTSLPSYEKLVLYVDILDRFLTNKRLDITPLPETESTQTPLSESERLSGSTVLPSIKDEKKDGSSRLTSDLETIRDPASFEATIKILEAVFPSKTKTKKALDLFERLASNSGISWDTNYVVSLGKNVLSGSHLIELIRAVVNPASKRDPPARVVEFKNFLKENKIYQDSTDEASGESTSSRPSLRTKKSLDPKLGLSSVPAARSSTRSKPYEKPSGRKSWITYN